MGSYFSTEEIEKALAPAMAPPQEAAFSSEDIARALSGLGGEAPKEASSSSFLPNMIDLTVSGFQRLKTGAPLVPDIARGAFSDTAPETIHALMHAHAPRPEELQQAVEELTQYGADWEEAEGFMESAGVLGNMMLGLGREAVTNPKGLAYLSAEQFANMVPSIAGMLGGAKVGMLGGIAAPVTVPLGAFGGAVAANMAVEMAIETSGFVGDALEERGLDPTEENIERLLSDPEIAQEIIGQVRRKAAGTALTDAALTLVGGKIAASGGRAVSRMGRAGRIAGGAAVEVPGEGVSEAVGQKWAKGEVDMGEVALETFAGLGGAAGEMGGAAMALRGKRPAATDEGQPTPTETPSGPSLADIETALHEGQITPKEVRTVAPNLGFSSDQIEPVIKAFEERPSPAEELKLAISDGDLSVDDLRADPSIAESFGVAPDQVEGALYDISMQKDVEEARQQAADQGGDLLDQTAASAKAQGDHLVKMQSLREKRLQSLRERYGRSGGEVLDMRLPHPEKSEVRPSRVLEQPESTPYMGPSPTPVSKSAVESARVFEEQAAEEERIRRSPAYAERFKEELRAKEKQEGRPALPAPATLREIKDRIQAKTEERKTKAKETVEERGPKEPIALAKAGKTSGVIIHPSTKVPGRFQKTTWDRRGFVGDTQHQTMEEAVEEAFRDGYEAEGREAFEKASQSRMFRKGEDFTRQIKKYWEGEPPTGPAIELPEAPAEETLDAEAHEAATSPTNELPEPTDAQKEAGNYKKGHINIQGLDVSIENPTGSERSGTDPDGKPWSVTMQHHYGYFRRSEGKDGEQIDVIVGPDAESQQAYVVDQVDPKTGEFDEHKTLVGFDSEEEARAGYLANYEPGWGGLGAITEMPMDEFKGWVSRGRQTEAVAPEIKEEGYADEERGTEESRPDLELQAPEQARGGQEEVGPFLAPDQIPADLMVTIRDPAVPEIGSDGERVLDDQGKPVPGAVRQNAQEAHQELSNNVDALEAFLNCL